METEKSENTVSLRPLCNGSVLNKFIGKAVTLVGQIISTNPNGTSFDVKTPDLQVIIVTLRRPLMEPVTGLVEVHGTVRGKNSIICDYFLVFPSEISSKYDAELTNDVITVLHTITNPWTAD